MTKIPQISVIIPVYNAARFLRESLDSILRQTFADFEVIAIDDGSTDASLPMLQRFAEIDRRIQIVSRPNTGIVGALNDGVSLARGTFLARMDADDIAIAHRFERQIAFMETHPDCVVVGSSVFIMDESGDDIHVEEAPAVHFEIEAKLLAGRGSICHPTVLMRADVVRRVGAYREEYRLATEDMDLFLRLAEHGRLANIQEPLLRYRWHLESISHRKKNQIKAGHARAAMLAEACRRRGIPCLSILAPQPERIQDNDQDQIIDHYHRWSVIAAKAGRFRIARKYALAAWWLGLSRKKSWWVLCHSLFGDRITARLTRISQAARFWR